MILWIQKLSTFSKDNNLRYTFKLQMGRIRSFQQFQVDEATPEGEGEFSPVANVDLERCLNLMVITKNQIQNHVVKMIEKCDSVISKPYCRNIFSIHFRFDIKNRNIVEDPIQAEVGQDNKQISVQKYLKPLGNNKFLYILKN